MNESVEETLDAVVCWHCGTLNNIRTDSTTYQQSGLETTAMAILDLSECKFTILFSYAGSLADIDARTSEMHNHIQSSAYLPTSPCLSSSLGSEAGVGLDNWQV